MTSEKSRGSIVLDLVKGSFRFVTGLATKPSYLVRVPNASITVRGTIFDVYVQANNIVWLLLHEGTVRVCNDRGRCRVLDEPGRLIRISDGDVGPPSRWTSLPGRQNIVFDTAFPFIGSAPQFGPASPITREAILTGRDLRPPRSGRGNNDDPPRRSEPRPRNSRVDHDRRGAQHARIGRHAGRVMFPRGGRRR